MAQITVVPGLQVTTSVVVPSGQRALRVELTVDTATFQAPATNLTFGIEQFNGVGWVRQAWLTFAGVPGGVVVPIRLDLAPASQFVGQTIRGFLESATGFVANVTAGVIP